jgi:hypothetical protein
MQMSSQVFWREYFVHVLPHNAEAVVAVVKNTCNQTFSFLVAGDHVTFLGPEDAHDPKYDSLGIKRAFAASVNTRAAPNNRAYTTVGLDDSFCKYAISVYPTQDLEDAFVNKQPSIVTAIAASIFMFTSLVFVVYDLLVAKRQKIVLTKALQSGAIVNALFPENVQSRLFAVEQTSTQPPMKHPEKYLPTFDEADREPESKQAIADLFPHCTVLFADIAGFTGWR